MSYILDALKKADSERNKDKSATTSTLYMPYPLPNRYKWHWIWALAIVNFILIFMVMTLFFWPKEKQTSQTENPLPHTLTHTSPDTQIQPILPSTKIFTDYPAQLDVHVYSPEPEKRFVIIDNNIYLINDQIGNDWRIRDITPEGAEIIKQQQIQILKTAK